MFLYLGQGTCAEIERLAKSLANRRLISLVYDKERDGSIYFPRSTWSEGRRVLYEVAKAHENFTYVVFMDGDTGIDEASLDRFEASVRDLEPAVAIPVFEKTKKYRVTQFGRWQLAYGSDEQMQAFRREILDIVFGGSPYVSDYDSQSWWYPCIIVQNVLRRFLWRSVIQLNDVVVKNTGHGAYPKILVSSFIEAELRRLGIRSRIPLTVNGRVVRRRYRFLVDPIDFLFCFALAAMSRRLFRPWRQMTHVALPPTLREMIERGARDGGVLRIVDIEHKLRSRSGNSAAICAKCSDGRQNLGSSDDATCPVEIGAAPPNTVVLSSIISHQRRGLSV